MYQDRLKNANSQLRCGHSTEEKDNCLRREGKEHEKKGVLVTAFRPKNGVAYKLSEKRILEQTLRLLSRKQKKWEFDLIRNQALS